MCGTGCGSSSVTGGGGGGWFRFRLRFRIHLVMIGSFPHKLPPFLLLWWLLLLLLSLLLLLLSGAHGGWWRLRLSCTVVSWSWTDRRVWQALHRRCVGGFCSVQISHDHIGFSFFLCRCFTTRNDDVRCASSHVNMDQWGNWEQPTTTDATKIYF